MIVKFFNCDDYNCKAFKDADEISERGTKEYAINLLKTTGNDGIWGLCWVSSAIVSVLIMWLADVPFQLVTYTIILLLVFLTEYVIFNFFIHHYIKPITGYSIDVLDNEICT